jgi:hypothetical protein
MANTNIQDTDDIIEDISEETLLSLDENLEQDQETSEIAEGNCEGSKEDESMEEAEVSSDKEFMEYAKSVLKAAHGDEYDEDKATATAEGILKKADGDYGAAIGILTSGLGEEMEDEEMEDEANKDMKEGTQSEITIDTSDISRLVESEEGLTEEFKEKASIIFEAAVKSKIKEVEEALKESYAVTLIEEVETIKEELVDKIDNYLTYAVESWVEDNKVAVESSLRTQIAENFMQSLKTVFEENYIEVPESKVDLYAKLEEEKEAAESKLAESLNLLSGLVEKVEEISREKIIAESTSDLADTQAEKLKELLEDIEFTNETAFRKKVQTIKEFYIKKQTSDDSLTESTADADSYITTSTIVENETETQPNVSPAMQKYLTAISRLNKANTANIQ